MIRARSDMFPAELVIDPDAPDPQDVRRVYPVRVIVTADEVVVFEDASPRPRIVFRDGLVSFSAPPPPHTLTRAERLANPLSEFTIVTTDSGHVLSYRRASGCGCGSRLKVLSLQALLSTPSSEPSPGVAVASEKDFQ